MSEHSEYGKPDGVSKKDFWKNSLPQSEIDKLYEPIDPKKAYYMVNDEKKIGIPYEKLTDTNLVTHVKPNGTRISIDLKRPEGAPIVLHPVNWNIIVTKTKYRETETKINGRWCVTYEWTDTIKVYENFQVSNEITGREKSEFGLLPRNNYVRYGKRFHGFHNMYWPGKLRLISIRKCESLKIYTPFGKDYDDDNGPIQKINDPIPLRPVLTYEQAQKYIKEKKEKAIAVEINSKDEYLSAPEKVKEKSIFPNMNNISSL